MTQYKWYPIAIHSGTEKKVKNDLKNIFLNNPKYKIDEEFKVLDPSSEIISIDNGKKRTREKRFYPGYLFINMLDDIKVFKEIEKIPTVSGFLGPEGNPKPLSKDEIDRILNSLSEKKEDQPEWEQGAKIIIKDGPFENFSGIIKEVNNEKIKVLIDIFGRKTPVELDFNQIKKIE